MKKIINGKKYDTSTAKELGYWSTGGSMSDFSYAKETLYRKKTGEFFLHGYGGARSKYARSCGENSWGAGEAITPLTEAEARAWAETHLTGEEYEAIFGEVEE